MYMFSSLFVFYLFVFKIFYTTFYCFLNFVIGDFTLLFNKPVSRNYKSACSGSFIPKGEKPILQSLIQRSKLPNIVYQFFEKFRVISYLSFTNVEKYFLIVFLLQSLQEFECFIQKYNFKKFIHSMITLADTKIAESFAMMKLFCGFYDIM